MQRLVFAHGFTQTGRSWRTLSDALTTEVAARGGERPHAICVDLPGHGDATAVVADLWQSADRLVELGGRATYVGYSMGGRTALHAALAHPDMVERLVLVGATAGIDDAAARADRRVSDDRLAELVARIGVEAFLERWLANPLFEHLSSEAADIDDRRRNTAAGLASSLRTVGTGTQEPLWDRLGEIRCPTLVLVGEHDAKFRALGDRLVDGIADASMAVIHGAGHSVHLEQPAATVDAIAGWLSESPSRSS